MAGFLPPVTESGYEVGWVSFSVDPQAGLPTGTQIENQAFVSFDGVGPYNPAPNEAPFVNTIDAGEPNSTVLALPESTREMEFLVEWTGNDDANGSGISSYDIYVSTDGGEYVLWLDDINDTSALFYSEGGHTYAFYSIARDNVGNLELAPGIPDTSITVLHHADFDGDEDVDFVDLAALVAYWLEDEPSVDIAPSPSGDGIINFLDFAVLARGWTKSEYPSPYPTLHDILGGSAPDIEESRRDYVTLLNPDANSVANLLLEAGGFHNENIFGIYNPGVPDEKLQLFAGPDSPTDSVTVKFDLIAGTAENLDTGDIVEIETVFGFYLISPDEGGVTFYTDSLLNSDNAEHGLLYNTSAYNGVLTGDPDTVVAFEDLFGLGDQDYDDMVVGITNATPD